MLFVAATQFDSHCLVSTQRLRWKESAFSGSCWWSVAGSVFRLNLWLQSLRLKRCSACAADPGPLFWDFCFGCGYRDLCCVICFDSLSGWPLYIGGACCPLGWGVTGLRVKSRRCGAAELSWVVAATLLLWGLFLVWLIVGKGASAVSYGAETLPHGEF